MTTEGAGLFVFSDIYELDSIVRNVGIVHGRTLLIDTLREVFARCREYRYVTDIYGYPKTPDHTDLDPDAGMSDEETTRIFIGTMYRYENSFLPAISVRQTSSSYKPISFNQNRMTLEYDKQRVEDGYGNVDVIRVPARYTFAGAWDQSFEIKVTSNSQEDTAAIADLVMVSLQGKYRPILQRHGLFIKQITAGGETAESINSNDPVFSMSITANTFSEWRREIAVSNLVERIQLCFNVDMIDTDTPATGLSIKQRLDS